MRTDVTAPVSKRALWADWIRGIAIFFVILVHVSAIVVQRWHGTPRGDWMAGNIYNVIARSCVPLLFMVSGALLLQPREESIREFYRKRVQKVVLPFLFWSVLYLVAKQGCFDFSGSFSAWHQRCYGSLNILTVIRVWAISIIAGPVEYHLWFMYALFAIYLFTPVLRAFVKGANDEHIWYLLALWFLFGPVLRLIQEVRGIRLNVDLGGMTSYVGYFVLGYMLTRIRITKPMVWISALVYIAAGVFTGYATFELSLSAKKLVDTYQYYLGLNIVLLSTASFILLKALGEKIFSKLRPRLEKRAIALTVASYGIYLLHVFVIGWMKNIGISPLNGSAVLMVPVTTISVFVVSWIVIGILLKIPYVRSLVV